MKRTAVFPSRKPMEKCNENRSNIRCSSPLTPFPISIKNEQAAVDMHIIVLLGALCSTPLGLQNGRIRNSRITASSEYNVYHAARLGRLHLHKRGRYVGAWCAKHKNRNQWFKVNFGRLMKITKIATQGRQDAAQWVTYYRVSSSVDGIHWQMYRFKNNDMVGKCDMFEVCF